MGNKYDKVYEQLRNTRNLMHQNVKGFTGKSFLEMYRQTLRVKNTEMGWSDWVNSGASRQGYGIEARFEGWGFSSPFPAVPFVFLDDYDKIIPGSLGVMVTKPKDRVATFVIINELNLVHEAVFKLNRAVPLFINKLGGANKVVRDSSELCTLVQKLYKEERDDLCPGGDPRWVVKDPTTIITGDLLVSSPNTINLKETDSMKNTKADNFIQDQKAIAKEIASLNAGRVSNKVVKEAMRPLVALLFKPTWMQKLAMKVTGAKNPLDEFMNTPYADLICAQLFKTAIDMRDVENAHVKKTANSAVIYAGLKVTEELPIEELIDKAIKQVTEATAQAVGKGE